MKVLFFNGYNISPHLETEMEIAKDLMEEGKEIFFVHCRGELQTCFANPGHKRWICANCRDRKAKALRMLGVPQDHIVPFPDNIHVDEQSIPDEFPTIDALKQCSYKGVDVGMGVASSLVSEVRDHRLDTRKYREEIKRGIRTSLLVYESANSILDTINPDEVFLFNGRFLEIRPFMRACEQRGIPYYAHERGGSMDTYIIRANSTPHSLRTTQEEILSYWGDGGADKVEIGRKFFIDRRNRVMQAWIVFTEGQEKGKLPDGFDQSKRNIAIFNSSMDEYEGISGFTDKIYADDNSGIVDILESFREDTSVHFYLRIHPNLKGLDNSQTRTLEQIQKSYLNLTVIGADAVIDSYALMDAADIVVAFSSTMGAEAVFWGKPVVLLGNAFYGGLEGAYKPVSHQEVIALLAGDIPALRADDMLKYGYWELTKGLKYKYYVPQNLATGTFQGQKVDIRIIQKAINRLIH